MRVVQDITFDVEGQLVFFDAPEGRPSSVTSVQVFRWDEADDDADEEAALGSPSVETGPSTTLDNSAGAGQSDPRILPVAATTGAAIGRTYLVTSATGLREWFEVESVSSGVSLTAKHPLHNAYASGDAVVSTRIQAAIDPDWVADETNLDDTAGPNPSYRVRWVYADSTGATRVADTYFNLVRYVGTHGVRPQDIERIATGWIDRLPTDHYADQGKRLIDQAYQAVKIDLHTVWTDDAMVANAEIVDELTRYKAIEAGELAKVLAGSGSTTAYETARLAYQGRFDALSKITSKVPTRDENGGATVRPAMGLTRR